MSEELDPKRIDWEKWGKGYGQLTDTYLRSADSLENKRKAFVMGGRRTSGDLVKAMQKVAALPFDKPNSTFSSALDSLYTKYQNIMEPSNQAFNFLGDIIDYVKKPAADMNPETCRKEMRHHREVMVGIEKRMEDSMEILQAINKIVDGFETVLNKLP
jgi:hypothetical protein